MHIDLERFRCLPQRQGEVWQTLAVDVPKWVREDPPYQPKLSAWMSMSTQMLGKPFVHRPDKFNHEAVLQSLLETSGDAEFGGYRPQRIEVCDAALADFLRHRLAETGVEVAAVDRVTPLDEVMQEMVAATCGPPRPGLLDGRGVTLEAARSFAEAAALFHRAAPWRQLGDYDLLKIEKPKPPRGLGWATLMGGGEGDPGMSFFGSEKERWEAERAPDAAAWLDRRKRRLCSVTFGDITTLPPADADLWQRERFPLAGPEAYPWLMRLDAGGFEAADAKQLAFIEGVLRALAATAEPQMDQGRWTVPVETAAGPMTFTLALPDLLKPPTPEVCYDRGVMMDRRAMEGPQAFAERLIEIHNAQTSEQANALMKKHLIGQRFDPDVFPSRNAAEQAQVLCWKAFDVFGRRRRIFARQALAIDPGCVDALVLEAEGAGDLDATMALYARGVEEGERRLGAEYLQDEVGNFWGLHETRPYMRAKMGLAACLELTGRTDEAISHYREMLRLNPEDNQGVRDRYVPALLWCSHDREAAGYLAEHPEPSAQWHYTMALLAFRLGGNCARARQERARANDVNPHVRELLQDLEALPPVSHYSPGSKEEAVVCIEHLRDAIETTPGALEFLAAEDADEDAVILHGQGRFHERRGRKNKARKRR